MKKQFLLRIYPFALALFPIISLYDHNKDLAHPSYLIVPLLLTTLATWAVLSITNKIFGSKEKAAFFSALFLFSFLAFGHFFEFVFVSVQELFPELAKSQSAYPATYNFSILLWLGFVLFASLFIGKTKKSLWRWNIFLGCVSLALYITPAYNLTFHALTQTRGGESFSWDQSQTRKTTNPDIYYIILDGYARSDVLQDLYDFDNSSFLKELGKRGFFIATKSTSNYPQSYMSIASSLNFEYLQPPTISTKNSQSYRLFLRKKIRDNNSYDLLSAHGYSFVVLPSIWSGTKNNLYGDFYFENDLTINEFSQLLIQLTPFGANLGQKIRMDQQRNVAEHAFSSLPKVAKISGPTFTYLHILPPHPPFVFDQNGEPTNNFTDPIGFQGLHGSSTPERIKQYRSGYLKQLEYVNKRTIDSIDQVLETSEIPPVIIIQADHGPGSMLNWEDPQKTNLQERMSILNAYLLPAEAKEQLYDSISPVNSFRIVYNILFDADLELLEDKNYFARWSTPYDLVEVTDKLTK